MFLGDAIIALVLATGLGLLLTAALGVRGPWAAPWAVFVVLFLFIWAGGVWATPVGPAAYGVYWLPFVFLGLLLVLLIAAGSDRRPRARTVEGGEERAEEAAAAGLTVFFWLLIAALLAAIFLRYL